MHNNDANKASLTTPPGTNCWSKARTFIFGRTISSPKVMAVMKTLMFPSLSTETLFGLLWNCFDVKTMTWQYLSLSAWLLQPTLICYSFESANLNSLSRSTCAKLDQSGYVPFLNHQFQEVGLDYCSRSALQLSKQCLLKQVPLLRRPLKLYNIVCTW